ncbi:MAG: TIGR03564 family F420-dependent LLM class oxidoreductase [Actinomycetia bacterium]|nr:TIGR03564 family F420-dependent LLM class oxidoreductase [Actinomycetes bacterium]MCP4959547.1 TIGR03564 family F420-dependent LLM class oxidoreductase [Actinomycetes bacterium]
MGNLGVGWGYGVGTGVGSLDTLREHAGWAQSAGFESFWVSQIFGLDPIVAIAAIASEFPELAEFGTSVVPLTGRHPMSLGPAALTAQAATVGRFTLGVGPSHKMVAEGLFGESFARPFTRTREFVESLVSLFETGATSVDGEELFSSGWLTIDAPPVPILLAALGRRMLEFAGSMTAGTSLGSCGPKTIATHIRPRIVAAAEAAGRPAPRIVALVTVGVTDEVDKRRAAGREQSRMYSELPSYRAMLDIEGVASPADLTLLGSEDEIAEGLNHYVEAGVTDFRIGITGDNEHETAATRACLELLLR